MEKARYIRISTATQSTARQLAKQHPDEILYIDICSGAIEFLDRPKAKDLMFDINNKKINSISVSSVDRLGRNAFDIQQTIDNLNSKKVNLTIDNLGISSIINDKLNPIFKMITDVLANVSQMERENLLERQREGIAIAKVNGVYKGRVKGSIESLEQIKAKYIEACKAIKKYPNASLRELAKLGDCSPNTIKKLKNILQ